MFKTCSLIIFWSPDRLWVPKTPWNPVMLKYRPILNLPVRTSGLCDLTDPLWGGRSQSAEGVWRSYLDSIESKLPCGYRRRPRIVRKPPHPSYQLQSNWTPFGCLLWFRNFRCRMNQFFSSWINFRYNKKSYASEMHSRWPHSKDIDKFCFISDISVALSVWQNGMRFHFLGISPAQKKDQNWIFEKMVKVMHRILTKVRPDVRKTPGSVWAQISRLHNPFGRIGQVQSKADQKPA